MRRCLFVLFISVLFLAACAQDKQDTVAPQEKAKTPHSLDEKERVKNTVRLYNSLLAKGYREQNMDALQEAATEKRATKAFYHMAALGEGLVKMDTKMNDITFTDLRILSDDKAEVATEEKWDYKYINFNTGKEVYDNSVDYVNSYTLLKISNKWFVDEVDVMSTKEKKSEKYEPLTGSPSIKNSEKVSDKEERKPN